MTASKPVGRVKRLLSSRSNRPPSFSACSQNREGGRGERREEEGGDTMCGGYDTAAWR
jgi:hypothetical protein